ncbi:MAG: hydrolase [Blastopirellula sp.]|nr:MAG: hydrolase [Blastopirellula sp.]
MKFVTLNIQFGFGADNKLDLARTAEAVRGADIIALQEVERFWKRSGYIDQPAELARMLPEYHWVYAANLDLDASYNDVDGCLIHRRRQFGLMLLSRWPIISKRVFPLPKFGAVAHHSIQTGMLETVIDVPNSPIRVYTTHLSHLGPDIRKPQIDMMLDLIGKAPDLGGVWCGTHPVESDGWTEGGAPPMPIRALIAGDFNFTADSAEYDRFTGSLVEHHGRLISASGLRDAWVVAGNAEDQGITCPAATDAIEAAKTVSERIDYCFVNSDLWDQINHAWIDENSTASDHLPFWVEFDEK